MEALDLLTKEDLEKIEAYMSSYGGYGGSDIARLDNVGHLLRFWDAGKSGFLCSLMGHKLIQEREINIATPEAILQADMEEALYPSFDKGIPFIENFYTWMNKQDYWLDENLTHFLSIESLVKNTYNGKSFEIIIPDQKHPLQINRGCKIVKTLGKLANIFNIDGFEEFRLKHSMVLNQKNFRGTLCLSIHPLDYMTMSDNDSNWDSCMSWQKPGEYREGTVEMMNSSCVIVAYLKAENDMPLFHWNEECKWNNKRWRKLYVVTPDLMTGIKGYPYNDKILEAEIFKWLLELAKTNCPYCKYDESIPYNYGDTFRYHEVEMSVVYKFKVMYDDFHGVHIGHFAPTILDKLNKYNTYELMVSGPTMCLECGTAWDSTSSWDTQSLLCPDCTGEVKCHECEDFISLDSVHEVEGFYLCNYCVENYTNKCDYCEELYYKENTIPIYLTHNKEVSLGNRFYVCQECMNSVNGDLDKYYGKIYETEHPRRVWCGPIHTINSKNMTLNGFRAFGYFGTTIEEARKYLD